MEDPGMNKPELVAKIVEQMNLTKKQVEEVTAVLLMDLRLLSLNLQRFLRIK